MPFPHPSDAATPDPPAGGSAACAGSPTRFAEPAGLRALVARLVDARAEEGRDFDPARLMPFWQRTSEQDWEICENVQRGIASAHYRPGPFERQRERNVAQFVDWYLGEMAGGWA